MSDANRQSVKVKRCEYRHRWAKLPEHGYACETCDYRPANGSKNWQEAEAIVHLQELLHPGDTVYTVLRHVSRSGMSRGIDVYYLVDGAPIWITSYVGHAIGSPQPEAYWRKSLGLKIGGCGMDMGFHVVESLSRVIYPEYKCLGKYGHCPSAYHVNHRDTVQCMGIGTGDDWQPCHRSSTVMLPEFEVETESGDKIKLPQGKAYTVEIAGTETICPTCEGHGLHANPDGPERWDLEHKDGYALKHKEET